MPKSRVIMLVLWLVVVSAAVALAASGEADVEATIQKGLKAYKDGKAAESIALLQDAIAMMQKGQQQGMSGIFPKAPEGWEAGEIQTHAASMNDASGSVAITNVSRTYTRAKDDASVEITLTNSTKLIETSQAMAATYKNPEIVKAMSANGVNISPIDKDGWNGWMVVDKTSNAQAMAFSKGYMLSVAVNKPDGAALQQFWKAIDLKAVAAPQSPATSRPAK